MPERFINLNCTNCGAKLDVYDDIERFACGYCGTQLLVQRRGGTVAVKAVTEAIRKVQFGTDRTAAELALVRLHQESARLKEEVTKLLRQARGIKAAPTANLGCAGAFAGTFGVLGVGFLFVAYRGEVSDSAFGDALGLLMAGGSLIWLFRACAAFWTKSNSGELAMITKRIDETQTQISAIENKIAEQRKVVDSHN